MPIHIWRKKEEGLADSCMAVVEFRIEVLTEMQTIEKGHKYAEGEIVLKDYIENEIVFTEPWQAWGILQEDGILDWIVKKRKIASNFFVNKFTDEVEFTTDCGINRAIKIFIAQKIDEYLKSHLAIIELEKYQCSREYYQGFCLCIWLEASNKQNPFPWQEKTKGRFPQNCFQCSCGRRWWRCIPEEEIWAEVGDPQAWKILLDYNGIDVQLLGIYNGKFFLIKTLVNMMLNHYSFKGLLD